MGALSLPKRYMGCAGNGGAATIYAVEEDGGVWGESIVFSVQFPDTHPCFQEANLFTYVEINGLRIPEVSAVPNLL